MTRTVTPSLWRVGFGLALFSLQVALAHATIVFGTLTSTPRTPAPEEPFTLGFDLEDPSGAPVPFAYVFAEFRPAGAEDAEPIRAEFEEVGDGVYQTQLSLPGGGRWDLTLRDQTYRQEETSAELEFFVGEGDNPATIEFIFPPTPGVGQNLWLWLAFVAGLPILVGLVVTTWVLTRNDHDQPGEHPTGQRDA